MPGTVSEVSATFVASTTRRASWGLKTRCCSCGASRAYSGSTSIRDGRRPVSASAVSRISRSPDRNTSTSPGPSRSSSSTASPIASTGSRSGRPRRRPRPRRRRRRRRRRVQRQRAVANLDRVRAARHLDDRRPAEVLAEAPGVDRRARDDELEVRALGQQAVQVAEQEVDVQAALVRLVDDDRVVAAQQPVVLDLGQQQAVGDEPHERVRLGLVREADRVADGLPERHAELLGDPLGDGPRREPSRLRVGDRAAHAAARARGRSSAAASSCPSPSRRRR